jgi:hypothetical protein
VSVKVYNESHCPLNWVGFTDLDSAMNFIISGAFGLRESRRLAIQYVPDGPLRDVIVDFEVLQCLKWNEESESFDSSYVPRVTVHEPFLECARIYYLSEAPQLVINRSEIDLKNILQSV